MSVIIVRKKDGTRAILTDGGLRLDESEWPFIETFDEVADALSAMHVLEPNDPRIAQAKADIDSAKTQEASAQRAAMVALASLLRPR